MGYKWHCKRLIKIALDYLRLKNKKRWHIISGLLLCLICIISTIIAYPQSSLGQTNHRTSPDADKIRQTIGENTSNSVSQHSSQSIKIKIDNGLINLKIEEANLQEIFRELSKISGVPIILLDKTNTTSAVISLTLENVSTHEAVKRILNQISSGGLAIETEIKGGNATNKIYVITKKGSDAVQADAQQLLERIKKGEKPKPKEVADWLKTLFSTLGRVDPQGTGMYAVPVFLMLDKNYAKYKDIIFSLFQDRVASVVLRSVMLEIIGNHWEAKGSEKAVLSVFSDQGDLPDIVGKSAALLAQHHVDIGDELMGRYGAAPPIAKFYYAGALASLDRKQAEPLLRKDARNNELAFVRAAAIRALGKIGPDDPETIDALSQVVNEASEKLHPVGTFVDDSLSMEAVRAISQSKKPEACLKLLSVAENVRQTIDVRISALDELIKAPKSVSAQVLQALDGISGGVKSSKLLTKADKERMIGRISDLKNVLSK